MIDSNYYNDGGALVMDPGNSNVMYSGGSYYNGANYVMAVSKTINGGSSWTRSTLTAGTGFTYALAVDPVNSNIVYAGGDPALYKSTNAGGGWSLSSTGLNGIVRAIGINPLSPAILYVGTDASVFKSTNNGVTWADCGLDSVKAVLVHPLAPETVYAATNTGVYKSTNAGSAWAAMNAGLENLNVTSLGMNPGFYLFCGTLGSGMYSTSLAIGVKEQGTVSPNEPWITVYPNPFSENLKINFVFRNSKFEMVLKIFDVSGRLVRQWNHETIKQSDCVVWSGTDDAGRTVPPGIYFCRLESPGASAVEKVLYLK